MAGVAIHSSIGNMVLKDVLAASLRTNRLDPKLLYVTPRQAELWREVSLKHSPMHSNWEFARIYREAFKRIAEEAPPGKIHVVGLGPGTGKKEAKLAAQLQLRGHEVLFTAIDVSRELVDEASRQVCAVGGEAKQHLVCDLAELNFIKEWLDAAERDLPRIFTLFGLVPNLEPAFVTTMLHELVRPKDTMLISVHLAPVSEGVDQFVAMKKILPQYNNGETLAWLRAAMEQWKLNDLMEEPQIVASSHRSIPSVCGLAPWKSSEKFLKFTANHDAADHPVFELFYSLRYTPELFEALLKSAQVQGEMLAITACREEAIWAITPAHA